MKYAEFPELRESKQSVALRRVKALEREIETDPSGDELMRLISDRDNTEDYVRLARRLCRHLLFEADSDSVICSAVSNIAVRKLPEEIRLAHADKVRCVFTVETARAAGIASQASDKGKKSFDRQEQIRATLSRGDRPWSDAEEMTLIALAQKLKMEHSGRQVTDWYAVAARMNAIFPDSNLDRLTCRRHGTAIFERHRNGKYGRGMPATHREAFERAIHSLTPPTNGIDAVTSHTIHEIQSLLDQEEPAIIAFCREVESFIAGVNLACVDENTKQRATSYRGELLLRDEEVEAAGKEYLYGKLTKIINVRPGQFVELLSPR